MAFPASLDTVKTNWLPGERPIGHAAHHNSMGILLYAIQTKLGINGSADTNSIDYKISALTSSLSSGLALKANLSGGNAFSGNQSINGVLSTTGSNGISIATLGGSTPDAINIGSGGTYIGQINGDTFIRSAFAGKSFYLRNSSSVIQFSVGYGTGNIWSNGSISVGNSNTASGQMLQANGLDHVYFAWLVNASRKAYMGFAAAGLTTLEITNEMTNGDINLKTNGTGQVKVNGVVIPLVAGGNPSGCILLWSTASAPSGYLLCDGTAVSRSTYSTLFSKIGTTYGVGDGSTTFNLPNLNGRIAVGQKSAVSKGTVTISIATPGVITLANHGLANGQKVYFTTNGALPTGITANIDYYIVNSASGTFQISATNGGTAINTSGTQSGTHTLFSSDFNTLGGFGGAENVKMTANEIPSHNHTIPISTFGTGGTGYLTQSNVNSGTINSGNGGGDVAHQNLPPYIVLNYIIKI